MLKPGFLASVVVALLATGMRGNAQSSEGILLSIGVEGGDTLAEFAGVGSAIRLSNGDIVIADGASSQLRWFSATGKFIRAVGRRGPGPNEFSRSIYVYEGASDTVIVFDSGKRRFHYIDREGRFTREDTLGDRRRHVWVYNRVLVERTPVAASFERMRSIASSVPLPEGVPARRALPDRSGNLWVQSTADRRAYTGYGVAGRIIGIAIMPDSFDPYQIVDSIVLGRAKDSLGVERIQLRRFTITPAPASGPPSASRAAYDSDGEKTAGGSLLGSMLAGARNVFTAQEAFFSRNKRYTLDPSELQLRLPPNVVLTIVQASPRGHWLMTSHPTLRSICMFVIGEDWPFGLGACG